MIYVSTNLLMLDPAAAGIPEGSMPPVLWLTTPASSEVLRDVPGPPGVERVVPAETRLYYLLTPAVYAWVMMKLLALEKRAWTGDEEAEAGLDIAAERMGPIQQAVNERWAEFAHWRELAKNGRAALPPAPPATGIGERE